MKPVIQLVFRPAGPDDQVYVIRTWIESYRPEQPEMRTSDYEAWMRARINADVLLACHATEPTAILGWIAVESIGASSSRLHYVYVRRRYRKQGIARALFEQATGGVVGGQVTVTSMTEAGRAIKKSHPDVFRYLPL